MQLLTTEEKQLEELIQACEHEQHSLTERIHSYLQDMEVDYLSAHQSQAGLYRIEALLKILYNFKDKNYNRKVELTRRITFLKEDLDYEQRVRLSYFPNYMKSYEDELSTLEQQPITPTLSSHQLVHTLILLVSAKIKNTKLWFDKDSNEFFAFSFRNKTLKVSFPNIKTLKKKYVFDTFQERMLQDLGFITSIDGNRLVWTINGNKETIIEKTMLILSRVTFEVFHGGEGKTFIQYTDKVK